MFPRKTQSTKKTRRNGASRKFHTALLIVVIWGFFRRRYTCWKRAAGSWLAKKHVAIEYLKMLHPDDACHVASGFSDEINERCYFLSQACPLITLEVVIPVSVLVNSHPYVDRKRSGIFVDVVMISLQFRLSAWKKAIIQTAEISGFSKRKEF